VQEADGQSRGYTYRWNDEGTEAYLLAGGDSRDMVLTDVAGGTEPFTWGFPSRAQCLSCHTSISGGPLGLETGQVNNAEHTYPAVYGAPLNTIEALALYDLFVTPPPDAGTWNSYPDLDDTDASVEDRARAYLHSNCANCHRADNAVGVPLDLSWTTPFADMRACNEVPLRGDAGVPGALVITPGDAGMSTLYLRMQSHDAAVRMPPIGSQMVHDEAVGIIAEWINGMSGCP